MTIGDSIKRIRTQKGMTQKQLGDLMGVSVQTVSAYESGRRRPKMETIDRFEYALGVSLHELISGVDYLPNEEVPTQGFSPKYDIEVMATWAKEAKRIAKSGSEEEWIAFREKMENAMSDLYDAALLSVFRTLSDVNKQKAISYCEGLAATQPNYEFADTAIPPEVREELDKKDEELEAEWEKEEKERYEKENHEDALSQPPRKKPAESASQTDPDTPETD